MTNYLITGGTGSWGYECVKALLQKNDTNSIIIYSRNECKQFDMKNFFNSPKLKFVIGDVRDKESLNNACKNINHILHLAALKHVPLCEENPDECIKTNIGGTKNVIECAKQNNVERVVYVSTDKAVEPNNLYGMSKAVGERMMAKAARDGGPTQFVTIRGGNVIGTNGSVIPFFKKQIENTNCLTITHPEMTRFFISIDEAIRLLLDAAKEGSNGEIYVIKMKSYRIVDVANFVIKHFGNDQTKTSFIGLRPKEKIHELLISKHESCNTIEKDNYYIILPEEQKNKPKTIDILEYSSSSVISDPETDFNKDCI